jgi:hypothetical protein
LGREDGAVDFDLRHLGVGEEQRDVETGDVWVMEGRDTTVIRE